MLNATLIDVPRPFLDPIDSLVEALGVVALAIPRPLRTGTFLLAMDSRRCGLGLIRTDEAAPSVVHNLVGHVCRIPGASRVVIVSLRDRDLIRACDADDLSRQTKVMNDAGLVLHDWVVVGRGGLYCPRSLAGVIDPWAPGTT